VAFFRKKSGTSDGEEAPFQPQPEKAEPWFNHARAAAGSANFEYALELYANGIKWDPQSMSSHEAMFDVGRRLRQQGGKPATSRQIRGIDDGKPTPVISSFVAASFEWMRDLQNIKLLLKAIEASLKADVPEFAHWASPMAFNLIVAQHQKKPSKSLLLQSMDLFRRSEAWDEAFNIGELARQLDPSDADLANDLKNLAAQRAMEQGGYTANIGQEGSFRSSIRDAEKQESLAQADSLAGAGSTSERNLLRAREAYEADPQNPDTINRYVQQLRKGNDPERIEQAFQVYMKAFADTKEYRFRMAAGDIRIETAESAWKAAKAKAEAHPDEPELAETAKKLRTELLTLRSEEATERVAKYPTDRFRKFELGEVLYALKRYGDAMALLQQAMDEPKLQARAGQLLGRCFLAEKWYTDAIPVFEEAMRSVDATDRDAELTLKYDLMIALLGAAEQEQSVDHARQAKTICSEIMRKDIGFRDIRERRSKVDDLIRQLGG